MSAEFPVPPPGQVFGYAITVSRGSERWSLTLEHDRVGRWRMVGLDALTAALGREAADAWLLDFWHYEPLGRHVWALGNGTIDPRTMAEP